MDDRIFSVSELNGYIKLLIEGDPLLDRIYVRGEISNYKMYPSGHHYFTLKDQEGALKCVMFRSSAAKLRFRPENGMKVIAFGRISVYPRDGAYQLYVGSLTPDGVGDLHVAFEQLKEKLFSEGLFDEAHKKPLPRFPDTIAVVTSSAGAAVRDIIRVLGTRWPLTKVVVLPVRVQGTEAPAEIVGAIRYANRHRIGDVLITGRGGGSIEDLWAFNDERVARAIYASEIPVISAVGHEPDVTIADFVADLRAATPSNAAELAVPDMAEVLDMLRNRESRGEHAMRKKLELLRSRLEELASKRVMESPGAYIDERRIHLDRAQVQLISAASKVVSARKERFSALAASLDAMSPLKVLGRGYAIARKEDGTILRSAEDVKSGDRLTIRLQKDEIPCTAD